MHVRYLGSKRWLRAAFSSGGRFFPIHQRDTVAHPLDGMRMTLCPACQAIELHKLGAPGHALLRITDTQRLKPAKAAAITISTFVCQTCGTFWTYRDQKDGSEQGWQR